MWLGSLPKIGIHALPTATSLQVHGPTWRPHAISLP